MKYCRKEDDVFYHTVMTITKTKTMFIEDPTYAFGGSGVRKPQLALSEAFEEFGIDDRIYTRQHKPSDTFDVEVEEEVDETNQTQFESVYQKC